MSKIKTLVIAMALTLPLAGMAATPAVNTVSSKPVTGTLSPQQRGAAIGAFVRKWGPYAQQVYGIDVRTWSSRLVGQFAQGDATNIQRSLTRTTFEGAMAELAGGGHRITDAQVINKLAAASGVLVGTTPNVLGGSLTTDLVFTPIPPCRIADTRNAGGQIQANTSRAFQVHGINNFGFYGGSFTDCGMFNEAPAAVVLNVTAVLPAAAGYATVYAGDLASPPGVSSINYAAGAIVNNNVVVALNSSQSSPDYRIYTLRTAHYVVDIVGYYDTPHATAVDCVEVDGQIVNIAPGASDQSSAFACTNGYARTAVYCETSNPSSNDFELSNVSRTYGCTGKNYGSSTVTLNAISECCRVPGR